MAGRIWTGPYKPLGVSTQAVPGGGYINVDASAGNFGSSPLAQLGLQLAQGAAGIAGAVAEQLADDNEALVKSADARMGETEQALLFDPQNGYLNLQGQDAISQAPAVLDAYTKAQDRQMATLTDDDQRRMFGELADRRLASFSTQIERHAAAERQRWYDAASDRRIALMQADAGLHWTDDALLRRALGTARAEVREQAERKGWDSALTETALRQQTSRTLVSAIDAAVDRDPERAQALRTRYAGVIDDQDRVALDALLAEAQTRERALAASTKIQNATPPDGPEPTSQWQLSQADAIAEPAVRAATIRRLNSAIATDEARARALGERVLARVLKDGLTDPSQISIREWMSLDGGHRRAIERRLEHNARNTEPAPNPALVDRLAIEMTQVPYDFACRDLVPAIAHLPLPQWQRFRDWQAGLRRNDPTTEDQLYAIKRGLQLAAKMLPAGAADDEATNIRAGLVEDIDTQRRIAGKSPDDADIIDMLARYVPTAPDTRHTLEWDRRATTPSAPVGLIAPFALPGHGSGFVRVQDSNTAALPGNAAAAAALQAAAAAAAARVADATARLAAALQAVPAAGAAGAMAVAQAMAALNEEIRAFTEATDRAAGHYPYIGNFQRIPRRDAAAAAARHGYVPTDTAPIDAHGELVFVHPDTGDYIVRATDVRTPGVWERFDRHGNRIGFFSEFLTTPYPDPPLNPAFTWATPLPDAARPHAIEANPPMTDEEKAIWAAEQRAKQLAAQKAREQVALAQGGVTAEEQPPPDDDDDDDENNDEDSQPNPPDSSRPWRNNPRYSEAQAKAEAERMGYREIPYAGRGAKGVKVYRNPDRAPGKPEYIARDIDVHGGSWKGFRMKGSKLKRIGSWDAGLENRIGK